VRLAASVGSVPSVAPLPASPPLRGEVLRRSLVIVAWALGALAFIAFPWMPTVCPMRLIFGVPCPTCGITRAARELLHGDLAGATHMHPLWWLVLPYVGAIVALEARDYVLTGRAGKWGNDRWVQRIGVVILALLLIVWCARAMGAFGGPVDVG
jgi:hypothetical protein